MIAAMIRISARPDTAPLSEDDLSRARQELAKADGQGV
jgi:hypothetical protein